MNKKFLFGLRNPVINLRMGKKLGINDRDDSGNWQKNENKLFFNHKT